MAHHKRKRPRAQTAGHYSNNGLKHRLGDRYHDRAWLKCWPRSHDLVFHTRPARARRRELERQVLKGFDPDDMTWPDYRRPHIYYW